MTDPRHDITLFQLTSLIKEQLEVNLDRFYWLKAEISELRVDQRGHCYITFIEKDERSQNIAARMSAHCWSSRYRQLSQDFCRLTGQTLKVGLKILCCVEVEMHSVYNISLNIVDIDADFSAGELLRQRLQTIDRLKKEGIFDLNRQSTLSKIPNRLAVISSDKAAGYGDFLKQLADNIYGFRFEVTLFPALMQGDQAAKSIIRSLELINNTLHNYDTVLIMRGGGATSDMNCFDDYELAAHVAQFPLPIIAGIGHDRDTSVVDMVAYKSVKTPTAAAEWLVAQVAEQQQKQQLIATQLIMLVANRCQDERNKLMLKTNQLQHSVGMFLQKQRHSIEQMAQQIYYGLQSQLMQHKNTLKMAEQNIQMHNPANIYKQGYALLQKNGKTITTTNQVLVGDILVATLADQKHILLTATQVE